MVKLFFVRMITTKSPFCSNEQKNGSGNESNSLKKSSNVEKIKLNGALFCRTIRKKMRIITTQLFNGL